MIDVCNKCGNVAEVREGLCSICEMEKEIDDSKVLKNTESAVKDAMKRIVGIKKESSMVVKEGESNE